MKNILYRSVPLLLIVSIFLASFYFASPQYLLKDAKKVSMGGQDNYKIEDSSFEVFNDLSCNIKIVEEIPNGKVFYCQTPYKNEYVWINGHRINCQIAVTNSGITVGFPIISCSY